MYSDMANREQNDPFANEVRHYLRTIRRELHCPQVRKAQFLKQMRESISRFASENPDISIADLIREFGSPEQIAQSFMEEADLLAVGKSLRLRWKILLGILAVAVAGALILGTVYVVDTYRFTHGDIVVEVGYGTPPANSDTIVYY